MSGGDAPSDVFAPILAKLASDAEAYFGIAPLRMVPAGYQNRPFSHLLRLSVHENDDRPPIAHVFVKVFKQKKIPGGSDALRQRVAGDFETTRRVHAAMREYAGLGTVPPVACYPDLLAIVTEQIEGPTLLEYLQQAAWFPTKSTVDTLCATMERVGRWIHVYQKTDSAGGHVSIADLTGYIDHRLATLVRHGGLSPDDPTQNSWLDR